MFVSSIKAAYLVFLQKVCKDCDNIPKVTEYIAEHHESNDKTKNENSVQIFGDKISTSLGNQSNYSSISTKDSEWYKNSIKDSEVEDSEE